MLIVFVAITTHLTDSEANPWAIAGRPLGDAEILLSFSHQIFRECWGSLSSVVRVVFSKEVTFYLK